LLRKHFHEKVAGAPPDDYPGHNICCVAYDENANLVGMDFNQCKADQHLCSHAEKRLADALSSALLPGMPAGNPPSLAGYTFISSLEPCHMCANYITRMGVKRIGYLMKDAMQKDALDEAARKFGLTIYRPGRTAWSTRMEAAFVAAKLPVDEITTWLGDPRFLVLLDELCSEYPLAEGSLERDFFDKVVHKYPEYVEVHPARRVDTNRIAGPGNSLASKEAACESSRPARSASGCR
jgi:tRNA(Arg) A34 adenosine deaminase TadA